jgi:hypothetical protein
MGQIGPAEVVLIILLIAWPVAIAICILKRKLIPAILSLVTFGITAIVGASRLAKPDSYWARRFYEPAKLERARQRFPDRADYVPPPVDEMFR